jgi:hypothetical protein
MLKVLMNIKYKSFAQKITHFVDHIRIEINIIYQKSET